MTDPFIPYGRQSVDEDDVAAVAEVLRGEWLTTGPAVEAFEEALSEAVGGVGVVSVSSGTAALHAAYAVAGLGPGSDLVTTPLTFAATATAALHLGARVEFADVSDGTLSLDADSLQAAMTSSTRAVTAVDFAGQPADLSRLRKICDDADVLLIEDAAHAIGGRYDGEPVGSIADLTTFSFHPVKTITTAEGGAIASPHDRFVVELRRFRNHGLVRDTAELRRPDEGPWHQEVQRLGLNYRLPDVLAALGTSQLRKLEAFVTRRAHLVARYREHLAGIDGLRLTEIDPRAEPAWHLFTVRIEGGRRREVFERLRSRNIGVQVHYLPAHRHPVFEDLGYRAGMCPVAERAYEELLSLPLFPALTEAEQDRVIEELSAALRT